MTKKTFSGGLSSLLGEAKKKTTDGRGRPKTQTKVITKTSQIGTKEGEVRATFIISETALDKLKALAYWERKLLKDVVGTALEEAIVKHEKKHGNIKAIPKS
jgi:hypothetical protein